MDPPSEHTREAYSLTYESGAFVPIPKRKRSIQSVDSNKNKRFARAVDEDTRVNSRGATRTTALDADGVAKCIPSQTNGNRHYDEESEQLSSLDLPDFEMNASWGRYLTKRSPFNANPQIRAYLEQAMDPHCFEAQHAGLYREYREAFERFFNATPLSFHAHVSDVGPALIASVITHLERYAEPALSMDDTLNEAQKQRPQLAMFERSFGTYYGPLAHGGTGMVWGESSTIIGTPSILSLDVLLNREMFLAKLIHLRSLGHIALLIEIVRQHDGYILSTAQWETICSCCDEVGLYVVVDEALTAIRCGAPFAFQLPQYAKYRPSFVQVGKAVVSGGLAVCWDGVRMSRLAGSEEEKEGLVQRWDGLPSLIQDPFLLLRSWGTIILAEQEGWTERAVRIGHLLRRILREIHPKGNLAISGLAALIYLPASLARKMDVIGAAVTEKHCRWMPYLDAGMADERQLRILFGPNGRELRQRISEKDTPGTSMRRRICIVCAEASAERFEKCEGCCGVVCNFCSEEKSTQKWAKRHVSGKCLSERLLI